MEPTTSEYIEVRKSKIHNNGVFAKKDIPKGAKVIQYVGEKIDKKESDKRCDEHEELAKKDASRGAVYIFELDDKWDIDGDVPYNTAKYINHSCDPNCDVDIANGEIWIVADRDIKKGEELSYNYSYDLEDYEDSPCRCGTKRCVGYIVDEEDWPELKKQIAAKSGAK